MHVIQPRGIEKKAKDLVAAEYLASVASSCIIFLPLPSSSLRLPGDSRLKDKEIESQKDEMIAQHHSRVDFTGLGLPPVDPSGLYLALGEALLLGQ